MHFRNTLLTLAIASTFFLGYNANAQMGPGGMGMGYYAGVQNCEMGGAGTLTKEEKEDALKDKAKYKFIEKELIKLEKSIKRSTKKDAEEYGGEIERNKRILKNAMGDENFKIFWKRYSGDISCSAECINKKSCSLTEGCEAGRVACEPYVASSEIEQNYTVANDISNVVFASPNGSKQYTKAECDTEVAKLGAGSQAKISCPAGGISGQSLYENILGLASVEDPNAADRLCRGALNKFTVCASAKAEDRSKCTEAFGNLDQDLVQDNERYTDLLEEYDSLEENLAGVDFYTEGSYCAECQAAGNRRFVDDRSGFRRFFDTAMPILGGAAAAYGGYRLNNEAIDRATNLGFTTNPAPSFLSYGYPMIMNGIYGGIASGIGSGAFQCGNTMGGGFPGGANGMMGPYGMNGMMGQGGSPFGYPFGQSPYGMNGYGGGPYMPGLVGGYSAGPWGVGGNLGYGVGIPQIGGFPGGGTMGYAGAPGMGGGFAGFAGGGFAGGGGFPGMGGGFAGGAGFAGGGGFPGMGGAGFAGGGFQGIGGMGYAGLYSVPGAAGMAGYAGGGFAGGLAGYAGGLAGYAGVPGAAGIAGGYGLAGMYGSIGSSAGLQYQQQLIQQQMQQYQQQMSALQQYQEYEINRQRTRSQLTQQMQTLQMQLYQLESGGGSAFGGGAQFGTGVTGQSFLPPAGTYNPAGNPAR